MTQESGETALDRAGPTADAAGAVPPSAAAATPRKRRRYSLLTRRDKLVLGLMVGIPLILDLVFIWGPAIASVGLSFTQWRGIHGLTAQDWVGLGNYEKGSVELRYPAFWEGLKHNILWFAVLMFIATPIGMFFAILLDREMKGTRIYQSIFFMPVVLSLALIGIIWEMQYSQDYGFIDAVLRTAAPAYAGLVRRSGHQPLGGACGCELEARRIHHGSVSGGLEERRPVSS